MTCWEGVLWNQLRHCLEQDEVFFGCMDVCRNEMHHTVVPANLADRVPNLAAQEPSVDVYGRRVVLGLMAPAR